MEKPKTVEVSITSLRITAEDDWLAGHIARMGDSVKESPHYQYLMGFGGLMGKWMAFRGLPSDYLARKLVEVLVQICKVGQVEPIRIYPDGRINDGHKRAACMMYLGYERMDVVVVPEGTKL